MFFEDEIDGGVVEAGTGTADTGTSTPVESTASEGGAGVGNANETVAEKAPESSSNPAPSSPPVSWYSDYDFSSWDGEIDSLPEGGREVGRRFHDYYSPRVSNLQEELDVQRELYTAMLDGHEDPRVGSLTQDLESVRNSVSDWEKKYGDLEKQHYDYKKEIETAEQKARQDWLSNYKETNKDVFDGGENEKRASDLVSRGWTDPDTLVELVRGPEALESAAYKYMQDGVPPRHALRMAKMELGSSVAPPTPSAKAISGGYGAGRSGSAAEKGMGDVVSLRDRSKLAARRALRKANQ